MPAHSQATHLQTLVPQHQHRQSPEAISYSMPTPLTDGFWAGIACLHRTKPHESYSSQRPCVLLLQQLQHRHCSLMQPGQGSVLLHRRRQYAHRSRRQLRR